MRKLIGLLIAGLWLSVAPLVRAQEHAPLLDQCKADLALWYSEEDRTEYLKAEITHNTNGTKNPTDYARLPIKVIDFRIKEMGDCGAVSGQDEQYYKAEIFYADIRCDRYFHFLARHHLMQQFLIEDEKGTR